MKIHKEPPANNTDFKLFIAMIDFKLPKGYLDFMKSSNGVEIELDNDFIILHPLTELFELNNAYNIDELLPGFFIIGSNGSENAYAVEKQSGKIFKFPMIGLDEDTLEYVCDDFEDLLNE